MPQTIALIATFASAYASTTIGATAIFYGVQGAIYAGLSIGLNLLASAIFKPPTQKPEDGQASIKQPLQFRNRQYGRGKKSGAWIFAETKGGTLYKILAVTQGPIDAIEEYWLDDKLVTVDEDGDVFGSNPQPRIVVNLGAFPETAFAEVIAAFPTFWTSNHRGDGIVSMFIRQDAVDEEDFVKFYPKGVETLYRIVFRGVKVLNPNTDVVEWSDNAAACIMDFMSHAEGMRLPSYLFETPLALQGWQDAFDRADIAVPLKAGGDLPAYRLWGSYSYDERPADVLGRMLVSCDGKLKLTSDGGITLDIGTWVEPTVTLDEGAITAFTDFGRGRNILDTANTIHATYLDATHDYQTTEADPWIDEDDVLLRGEIAQEVSFIMAPHHSQCRRLMKLEAYRRNPSWIATIVCNLKGMAAFGERFIRITYPPFGLDEVFEVMDFKLNIGENNILNSVTLQVQSMPEEAYEWDAATEEGTAPEAEKSESDDTVPIPTNFSVIVDTKVSSGIEFPFALLSFDPAPTGLTIEARGKKTSDTEWFVVPVSREPTTTTAESGALSDGEEYEFQVRHITTTGRVGDWSASEEIDILLDPTPPDALVSLTTTNDYTPGYAILRFVTTVDDHLDRVAVYKVATGGALDTSDPSQFVTRLSPILGSTNTYIDGDNTVSTLLTNGDFALAAPPPTLGANWTVSGGKGNKSSGGGNSITWTVSIANATTYRMGVQVDSISGASASLTPRNVGTLTENWTAITTSGTHLQTITTTTSNTAFAFIGTTATVAQIDNVVLYIPTSGSITQGVWDYYVVPENISGLEGTPSGPLTITVI